VAAVSRVQWNPSQSVTPIGFTANAAQGAGVTAFMLYQYSTVENRVAMQAPCDGTIRNLYAYSDVAPGAGETLTYTVRVAEADTAVTCQIAGAADQEANDLNNSVEVNADDMISVKCVSSAGAAISRSSGGFLFIARGF